MRKMIGFLLLLLAAAACRDPLLDSLPRFMREQDRFSRYAREDEKKDTTQRLFPKKKRDTVPEPAVPEYVPSVYATAFHFRDSVNWRKDSLGRADLLFFKDGEQVLRIPVTSPPDPERHRIWDGHLWSDYTDGHETMVLCDDRSDSALPGRSTCRVSCCWTEMSTHWGSAREREASVTGSMGRPYLIRPGEASWAAPPTRNGGAEPLSLTGRRYFTVIPTGIIT